MEHQPMMSAQRAEQIRRWQESAHAACLAEGSGGAQTFAYLDRTIVVPPTVNPIHPVSRLLGEAVLDEVRAEDRVLDMGTGSGVNAILAAGTARDVLAVDINPDALEATEANAQRNGVAERITVRHSDVFDNVDGLFDLIVFDPPFRWFAPRDMLARAMTDENYHTLRTFFASVDDYLTPDGRMLIFFGNSGDIRFLEWLIEHHGFTAEVLANSTLERDGLHVEYRTHLVRRR